MFLCRVGLFGLRVGIILPDLFDLGGIRLSEIVRVGSRPLFRHGCYCSSFTRCLSLVVFLCLVGLFGLRVGIIIPDLL